MFLKGKYLSKLLTVQHLVGSRPVWMRGIGPDTTVRKHQSLFFIVLGTGWDNLRGDPASQGVFYDQTHSYGRVTVKDCGG